MGTGKKAARMIDRRLTGEKRYPAVMQQFEYDQKAPAQPSESRRHELTAVPAAERVKTFEEAMLALSPAEALDEASRCLRCDIRESAHH
jgi:NADH-quinone oxidoreductase subunit F